MRPTAFLLVALLAASGGLAGCLGEDEPMPEAPAVDAAATAEARNATVDDGTGEMAADLGAQPHLHDYWKGAERIVLMDEDVSSDHFTTLAFTFFNAVRGTPGVGGAWVELPEGQLVYEGTGELVMTVTWTDATVTGMGVQWQTAASQAFGEPAALASGQALTIPVAPEDCDMPHGKTSRWAFLFVPQTAGQAIAGTFHVRMEIVKTRDVTAFPGHPDLFGDAHTLTLFDGAASSSQQNFATQVAGAFTGAQRDADAILSEKVVPMETQAMTANVTVTSATSTLGEVSRVDLFYRAADSWGYERAQLLASDPATGVYQFGWPVEMQQTDSPYAKESQWRFLLRVATDPAGLGGSCGGCSDAKVDFTAVIVAYDAPVEGLEPAPEDDD